MANTADQARAASAIEMVTRGLEQLQRIGDNLPEEYFPALIHVAEAETQLCGAVYYIARAALGKEVICE